MPSNFAAIGPILVSRSDLLERLVDFEIEPGAEFVVELLQAGYSLSEEWELLPKSAHASENGIVLISVAITLSEWKPLLALLPPFPIVKSSESNSFDDFREFVMLPRTIGIILLRLGHWAFGIAKDGDLSVTKTGARYVKGKHRKGGQSSNRFRRGREKWIRELFDQVGEAACSRLSDYPDQIDFLSLGGDKVVLGRFLKRVQLPNRLNYRVLPNHLPVNQPGRDALDAAVRDAWSYRVFELQ